MSLSRMNINKFKDLDLVHYLFISLVLVIINTPEKMDARENVDQSRLNSHSNGFINISGIYPHLTMRNNEKECGTGALVVWQDHLWAITYAPHEPGGSSDKLYQITPDLKQTIFPGSIGGTPANRMIHRESNQLLIGPYIIDSERNIRTIPYSKMFGRLTANARHLTDPRNKVYYATMEEGLYEVDVNTLEVICHIRDGNGGAPGVGLRSVLPGYHGKGLYSGQDRLIYANNGERHPLVKTDPTIPSGSLAEWFGNKDWQMVRRNQFTEVTGPGGIYGNTQPKKDPVWTMGWDERSIILGLLEGKKWYFYRLPKGSHSYDGSHGWNTEWPRIRDIGEKDLLATMHGTFWRFPATFSRKNTSGIKPRSNYLKVIGDFCRWKDQLILGCDDSAQAEFYNTRPFKASHAAPKQSNSNLWFIAPKQLDQFGPAIGRGSVWLRDDIRIGQISDPYLFSGYDHRQLHLSHKSKHTVQFVLEVDRIGNNEWSTLRTISIPPSGAISHQFTDKEIGSWIRIRSNSRSEAVTAHFQYANQDLRSTRNSEIFKGIAKSTSTAHSFGLMRSLAYDKLGIVASQNLNGDDLKYYELNQKMELVPVNNPTTAHQIVSDVAQPHSAYMTDNASVIIVEDGKRYRLPKSDPYSNIESSISKTKHTLEDYLAKNLAKEASISVSSIHESYSGEKAIDGKLDDDSRWIGSPNQKENWIELDLGETTSFQSAWIVTGWQNGLTSVASNFDFQILKGNEWQTIETGKIRNNTQSRREIVFKKPIKTKKVRLLSKTKNDYFRVYEIVLFENRPDIKNVDPYQFRTARVCREVATERDLLNIQGTFYELPARNAQGLAKVRPISTHNLHIHDFCSHNGLLLFTGIDANSKSEHIFRSSDGQAAVWAGVVDDLWKLGKPTGNGGPWNQTKINAGEASDPYLMTGYDKKNVHLKTDDNATITLEVDVDGTGLWIPYKQFHLKAGSPIKHNFKEGFNAYWIRATSDRSTTATVMFKYH